MPHVDSFGTAKFPTSFTVEKSVSLQFTDMVNGNNKFYVIELHTAPGHDSRIYTCYGRTGSAGKKEERFCNSYNAPYEVEAIVREKKRKGYKEVELAATSKGTDEGNAIILSTDVKLKPTTPSTSSSTSIPAPIVTLVERLYVEAGHGCTSKLNGSLKANAENPLGTLTLTQINAGKEILQSVNKELVSNPKLIDSLDPKVLDLTNDFYGTIPQEIPLRPRDAVGREEWMRKYSLNNKDILDDKFELLDLLGNVQGMISGFSTDDVTKKYLAIGCEINPVDANTFDKIKKSVEGSQSSHHRAIRVKNVYEIKIKAQESHNKVIQDVGNVKTLFHGSGPQNILGICKSGLLMRPPGVYITGSMFGPGLYFADQSTKSAQYAWGRFSGIKSTVNTYFMYVADVALGTIKQYDSAQSSLTTPPKGYDSVQGVKGSYLLHDEFIIYNKDQHRLNYLVEFEV